MFTAFRGSVFMLHPNLCSAFLVRGMNAAILLVNLQHSGCTLWIGDFIYAHSRESDVQAIPTM